MDKIINKTNLTFQNVSINEMNKIEKKLEININVFTCNKNYKNKNPVRKSKENYDKILDLLLTEDINHYIMIKNLHCFLTNKCTEKDNFICRTCLNIFYSETKYNDHISFHIFPHGEKWEKSIWKEREKYSFSSLSIYFFPHFSPWEEMGKHIFFHGQKWGWTPHPNLYISNDK